MHRAIFFVSGKPITQVTISPSEYINNSNVDHLGES